MPRKTFLDIIKTANVDICSEYKAVRSLFYEEHPEICEIPLCSLVDENFIYLPIHGTCLSLSEFDERHGFNFRTISSSSELNDLILLVEYVLNIVMEIDKIPDTKYYMKESGYTFIADHIRTVCGKIHYEIIETENGYVLVESNPAAIEAAQTLSDENIYLPLQYSHHSLKGDIQAKRSILLTLSNELEPNREVLKGIDRNLENNLFFCLNNLNIRHNNTSKASNFYIQHVDNMSDAVLEKWYDYIYNMMLVALIKLGTYPSSAEMRALKENVSR